MMVMNPSDSVSSMGSQMVRMDSNAALSQTSSLPNIHELGKDGSKARLAAAGSATNFTTVREDEDESDMESVMQRAEPSAVGSDDESVMERVVQGGDDESVMERVVQVEAASDASSVMI